MAGRPQKTKGTEVLEKSKAKIKAVKKDKSAKPIKVIKATEPPLEVKPEKTLAEEAAELMQQKIKEAVEQQKNESKKSDPAIVIPGASNIKAVESNMPAILAKYEEKVNTPSDINELLPYLRAVAEKCPRIVEFGVRQPTSTWALLAGNPESLISYDVYKDAAVDEVEAIAPNFKFILGSTLEIEIEETDFIFIDTVHTATQLERELARHADKAKKYLGFHDIFSFGDVGEYYQGIDPEINCGRGLWAALTPFLENNPEWKVDFKTSENNGLLILRRVQ